MASRDITIPHFEDLALTNEDPPSPFINTKDILNQIDNRQREIDGEDTNKTNYLSFKTIHPAEFNAIDEYRDRSRLKLRFTYFPAIETLIAKNQRRYVKKHIVALDIFCLNMWVNMRSEDVKLWPMGATMFKHLDRSLKEGDSMYKNKVLRPSKDAWPSLVVEAGNTEGSFPRLKADAKWWIESSNGDVHIVILLMVNKRNQKIRILKYVPGTSPMAQGITTDITIEHSVSPFRIEGGPLVLKFERVFCRQPASPSEMDIILSEQELGGWAGDVLL